MADEETSDPQQGSTQTVIEVSAFANYLRRVVPVLLEDADDTPRSLVSALKEKGALDCMKKFLSDPQIPVLFVQRNTTKGENLYLHTCYSIVLVCDTALLPIITRQNSNRHNLTKSTSQI